MTTPSPINLILIGSGHYATGQTALSGHTATDKDYGVLLPSALHLRKRGWVGQIAVCGQDGDKFAAIRAKLEPWTRKHGLDVCFTAYPGPGQRDSHAYLRALDEMARPRAALIAVPDDRHAEMMLACAERGIPFLIVKPAVTRLADFYRVKASITPGQLAMVDYHKVYDEANLMLLDDLVTGRYGTLQHVSSLMTQRRDMIAIYQRWLACHPGGNVNHYLGSHYIHLTGFLTRAVPVDVRATQQFGFIQQTYGLPVADAIQTHVRWRAPEGYGFTSYHIAGWTDPAYTEAMTCQHLHLLTEQGQVFSNQGYRGFRKTMGGAGPQTPNPYFFNLTPGLLGGWSLDPKYGFQSVRNFVELARAGAGAGAAEDWRLPTLAESETVTAILEAADWSLQHDSAVIGIERMGERLVLRGP